jgi:hypothetical protein
MKLLERSDATPGPKATQDYLKVTPPKDTPTKLETSKKRKVSPQKPSARKKTRASKPHVETTLTEDDIGLVRGAMEDVSEDLLQRYSVKQEELYGRS